MYVRYSNWYMPEESVLQKVLKHLKETGASLTLWTSCKLYLDMAIDSNCAQNMLPGSCRST